MEKDIMVEVEGRMMQFLLQSDIKENIERAVKDNTRCNIDLDQLRKFDQFLSDAVVKYPERCIVLLEKKLNEMMDEYKDDVSNEKLRAQTGSESFPTRSQTSNVNFTGNFGRHYITPRGLKANMLNKLVRVQGIVTRMSTVSPKLAKSYHYCETTKNGMVRTYNDKFAINPEGNVDNSASMPIKDGAGNALSHEFGYCEYKKLQKLVIQELPERAPPGQLPRSITVILENDLVDQVKPGDRVEVTGVYKTVPGQRSTTSGVFDTIIYGTGIQESIAKKETKLDGKDISNIKKVAKRGDVFDILANSVAPSIYGHHSIKKGILLQLLGGTERKVEGSGTHIRGDVNMLLVGDPSTAKSQLLRQVMEIAPLAINTTGRGSSGVGLTAAVIVDKDSGERHLEAGAMVLADKGIVCIDEFDKMNSADRVAIHEVMEQQTVTISKAGIHASLNARCSVIAAANPIYGDYDVSIPAGKNIGLPDSLLSRFDLLFVVLDDKDPVVNGKIAERVILNHRFRSAGEDKLANPDHNDIYVEPEIAETAEEKNKVYENDFNATLMGDEDKPANDVLNRSFLKKYLSYAKTAVTPVMNSDAVDFLSTSYSLLRLKGEEPDQTKERKLPITARTLETLIRLATAHAKLRLSKVVEVEDMQEALHLLNFSIFTHDDNDVKKESAPIEEDKEETKEYGLRSSKRNKSRDHPNGENVDLDAARKRKRDVKDGPHKENHKPNTRLQSMSSKDQPWMLILLLRLKKGREQSSGCCLHSKESIKADSFTMEEIMAEIQKGRASRTVSKEQLPEVISTLADESKVMLIEGGCILL
ncbi:unnamed protein product [Moneuplotes crassus]|uniref:DNA replication licensing factor MCM3 n=1 Tax=Euplotes crassus TaxID=5936 RepID=A0AAD2DA34_EUPCR|nr:unnamed protein product [Moneuplotes crassus]